MDTVSKYEVKILRDDLTRLEQRLNDAAISQSKRDLKLHGEITDLELRIATWFAVAIPVLVFVLTMLAVAATP